MPPAPLALSTCWHADRTTDGATLLRQAASLGFTRVELSHNTRFHLWPGILAEHKSPQAPKIDVLHNFCPVPVELLRPHPNAYEFSDPSPTTRRLAERHSLATFDAAASVGARFVVLHLGSAGPHHLIPPLESLLAAGQIGSRTFVRQKISALQAWEKAFQARWPLVEEILLRLGQRAQTLGLQLGLECRENPREIPPDDAWDWLLSRLPAPTFGYWHDFGHAAAKASLGFLDHAQHLRRLAPRLIGVHLHDYSPEQGDHLPLGQGSIPFAQLLPLIPTSTHFSLELSPDVSADEVRASLLWWKQNQPLRS